MTKAIQRNITALEAVYDNYKRRFNKATKEKVRNIIDLYSERKIAQFTTADNLVRKFITAKTAKDKEKADQEYNKIYDKHKDKPSLGERMEETKKENVRTGRTNPSKKYTYSIKVAFFKYKMKEEKLKIAFYDKAGKPLVPITGSNGIKQTANIKTTSYVENLVGKKVFRIYDKRVFKKLMFELERDASIQVFLGYLLGYVDCIRVYEVDRVDGDTDFNPKRENLRDATNMSMYHNYIQTPLNPEYQTLKEAIKIEHYQDNICWINTLTDYYKNTLMDDKKREKNKLTRESILKLINKTEDDFKANGASLDDMTKVFEHYRIQVRVYDVFNNLVYQYNPEKRDHHIQTLYAIIKNNHIYTVNDNLSSLKQMLPKNSNYDIFVKASSDYHLNEKSTPVECKMITSLNDIMKYTEEEQYTLIYDGNDLTKLFYESKQAGYEPQVKFNACIVSELNFRFYINKRLIKYTVKTQNLVTNSIDGSVCVRTENIYNRMSKAMYDFNKALFNPLHKSYYNEVDVQIFKECKTITPAGEINKHYHKYSVQREEFDKYFFTTESCVEIDVRKAFTYAFNQMTEIPVFTQFDVWKPYKKEYKIESFHPLTLYLVKSKGEAMFFNKAYCLVYGQFLKHLHKKCKILYYKEPSRVYNVDYKKIVDKLWATEISDRTPEDIKTKKLIANVNFGLLEKSTNTSSKSYTFNSLSEALYYQNLVGGKINKLSVEKPELVEDDEEEDAWKTVYTELEEKYYCLTVSDRATLRNGFIYIKELLLQYHNFKMYQDYLKLVDNNVDVWSVKTDAFVIRREHLRRAKNAIDFNEEIGGWRHEKGKKPLEPSGKLEQKPNELAPIPIYKNETINVKDEWNTEAIAKDVIKHNPLMIRSKYAGGGKSHIAKYFSKLGYKTLFVVPQNSLSQNIDDDAVTTNKFFAVPVGDGEKLPEFDHSEYNVVVFDEIFMNGLHMLNRIRQFVNKNPNKIIIGAGDTKQLPPIEDLTNTKKPDEYADECINQIFKYNILLTVCKRLGGKDDPKANENRKILNNMYDDMWLHKLPLDDFVRKYFKTTDDVTQSHNNIAYTNMRCLYVSNQIRKHIGKKDKYEVGETLICRVYKKFGSKRFNVNYRFKIVSLNNNTVILENVKSKEQYVTDMLTLDKHFRYDYCTTCHSAQGASINGKIIIHEWNKKHLVTREWIWCALTRSTDFNDVLFYESETDKTELTEENLNRYVSNKIRNYKLQDEKANRTINSTKYVTPEWFIKRINGNCCNCGCRFEFEVKNGYLTNTITAQRKDNSIAHEVDNCEAWCIYCNCSAK